MPVDVVENTTFTRCRSMVNRPLEINFSDGKGSQRIEPLDNNVLVDEKRLASDDLAKAQFESYVNSKKIRVIEENITFDKEVK